MDSSLFEKLHAEGLVSANSLERVKAHSRTALFSVHFELKTILYLGVLLLSTGLGILVYKNIDALGHQAVLFLILLVSAGCFTYCLQGKRPFSPQKVETPTPVFDYVLLLGCLTFITLVGYAQVQFAIFGQRFGLMFFIPMVVLFVTAYYFDHLGILSMAITNLATWCGIAITPDKLLRENNFSNAKVIIMGLLLGALLLLLSFYSKRLRFKEHFAFTYSNFGAHVLFVSCLAALFSFHDVYLIWFIILIIICWLFYRKALQERSFYYILILTLYAYTGISYVVIRLLLDAAIVEGSVYLTFLYFIASAISLVFFLISMNKKIKN